MLKDVEESQIKAENLLWPITLAKVYMLPVGM